MNKNLIAIIVSDDPKVAYENLLRAGKLLQLDLKIESKNGTSLNFEEITNADHILVLSDIEFRDSRFNNKTILQTSVLKGTHKAYEYLKKCSAGEGDVYTAPVSYEVKEVETKPSGFKRLFRKKA